MQENSIATVTASSATTPPSDEVGGRNGVTPHTSTPVTNTANANDIDQAQFEADKRAVYK